MSNAYPRATRFVSRVAILAATVLILGGLAAGCMTTVIGSGEAGVKYSSLSGTQLDKTYMEGLHVHAPWEDIIVYDVRFQEKLEEINALSSNGLSIGMDVSIRWRPEIEKLPLLHTTYGRDYYRKLVQPELRSAVRHVVGQFTPEELYSTRRGELQESILASVRKGVEGKYVVIDAVLIRDVRLPEQIQRAIENKLKEEQEAERYKYTLEKERLEAERKRIEAEGQAEYQKIITRSLSPEFLKFKGIEATRELANSPNTKVVVIGGKDGLPVILGNQ